MSDPHLPEGRDLTAKDVRAAADLSYRQINDWDAKGAVPRVRGRGRGWRRFTPRDVFVLMICSEIRRRFGVPLDRLAWLRGFMLQDNANHFAAAVKIMGATGSRVWLQTDLAESFVMDWEMDFPGLTRSDYFEGPDPHGHISLQIDPLANKLLRYLGAQELEIDGRVDWTDGLDREEVGLLMLIREQEFERIEVTTKDGKIRSTKGSKKLGKVTAEELLSHIQEHDFQTIKVVKRNGNVVSVEQAVPFKTESKA